MPKIISKNIMEELVDMFLGDYIRETGMCSCEQCCADVRAYALNHLPPKYIVSTGGGIFVRVNLLTTQSQVDIAKAIMDGIRLVQKNPRHNNENLISEKSTI